MCLIKEARLSLIVRGLENNLFEQIHQIQAKLRRKLSCPFGVPNQTFCLNYRDTQYIAKLTQFRKSEDSVEISPQNDEAKQRAIMDIIGEAEKTVFTLSVANKTIKAKNITQIDSNNI